jgi:hypothetical protein
MVFFRAARGGEGRGLNGAAGFLMLGLCKEAKPE